MDGMEIQDDTPLWAGLPKAGDPTRQASTGETRDMALENVGNRKRGQQKTQAIGRGRETMGEIRIEEVKHSGGREYLATDRDQINFARFYILESDRTRKNVLIRLKLLRAAGDSELTELLTRMFQAMTRRGEIFKVSIITSDDINLKPFTRLGFCLEGILQDHVYRDSLVSNEYVFGVTALKFSLEPKSRLLELAGERIRLKLATPEDAADYLEYYRANRDFLSAFEPRKEESFYTLEGQQKELSERFQQFLQGGLIYFGIYRKDRLIGKIQLSNIIPGSFRSAIVGYALSEDHLNQGYMSEAVGILSDYCFLDMGLHRLEASTLLDNAASQHVLLNNGFRLLGLNEKYLKINGVWQDHNTYYLTKEQWQANRKQQSPDR